MIYKTLTEQQVVDYKINKLKELEKRHLDMSVEIEEINKKLELGEDADLQNRLASTTKWLTHLEKEIEAITSKVDDSQIGAVLTKNG